tara:strand:+ start:143 stop:322 length:180 start_codon:yes stop_codon:yes gene_type:complete
MVLASSLMSVECAEAVELLQGLAIVTVLNQKLVMIVMAHAWQMKTATEFATFSTHVWER